MSKIKVMIFDDDIDWGKSIKEFLELYDEFELCQCVDSTNKALRIIQETRFDIILLDAILSDNVTGISLIKELSKHYSVKIIMLTGYDIKEYILESFAEGAIDYVLKENYKELPDIIIKAYSKRTPLEILATSFSKLNYFEKK